MKGQARNPQKSGDVHGDAGDIPRTQGSIRAGYDYSKSLGECPDSALQPDDNYVIGKIPMRDTKSDPPDFA